jgi:hypothetical protein
VTVRQVRRIRVVTAFGLAVLIPFLAVVVVAGRDGSSTGPSRGNRTATLLRRTADSAAVSTTTARAAVPSPSEFARVVADVANEYARAHHEASTIEGVRCVPGRPGDYMCAYRVRRPGRPSQCHLMQARWTPGRTSSFHVELAGRARACGSVREAIASLR